MLFALADLAVWALVLTTRGPGAADRSVTTSVKSCNVAHPLLSRFVSAVRASSACAFAPSPAAQVVFRSPRLRDNPWPMRRAAQATIDFLRRPSASEPLIAEGWILKDGARLVVGRVEVYPEGRRADVVAHISATYAVPPLE